MQNKVETRRRHVTEPLGRVGKRTFLRKEDLPPDEPLRLEILRLYQILDSPGEEVFDEIAHLAAYTCGCPIAGISFMDETRQWYKSRVGIGLTETPRQGAPCAQIVLQKRPLMIEDTKKDKRFSDYSIFGLDATVRFFAGMPLINKEGFVLGTICVADRKARHLTLDQTFALEALSRQIVTHLELRRALAEREMAEAEVHRLNQQLERGVEERTAQLNAAYESLKAEIADREKLQHQMLQFQKMEAVGRLAGGIAHDFNNILLVINGYSDLLVAGAAAGPSCGDFLREIQRAGKRGASLTRQLLTFSRRQIVEPVIFDLNGTVDGMSGMLRRLIGDGIKFEVRKSSGAQAVRADVSQVEQVIMNLVINACDAMPNGGSLALETSARVLTAPFDYDGGQVEPGRYTLLIVRDSGTGMTAEVMARMYEPFFTTKPEGKGTGLGLATCFGIVQQSGGHILCESELGKGTTFEVLLPAPDATPVTLVTGRLPSISSRGKETILLVEDDEAVRRLAALMLESFGYIVLEAGDGAEALALVQSRSQLNLDLLLSDLNMPGMNGHELADRLFMLRPNLKVMIMSGHTDDGLAHRGRVETQFLQKPFTPEQLSKRVREVLDQAAAT